MILVCLIDWLIYAHFEWKSKRVSSLFISKRKPHITAVSCYWSEHRPTCVEEASWNWQFYAKSKATSMDIPVTVECQRNESFCFSKIFNVNLLKPTHGCWPWSSQFGVYRSCWTWTIIARALYSLPSELIRGELLTKRCHGNTVDQLRRVNIKLMSTRIQQMLARQRRCSRPTASCADHFATLLEFASWFIPHEKARNACVCVRCPASRTVAVGGCRGTANGDGGRKRRDYASNRYSIPVGTIPGWFVKCRVRMRRVVHAQRTVHAWRITHRISFRKCAQNVHSRMRNATGFSDVQRTTAEIERFCKRFFSGYCSFCLIWALWFLQPPQFRVFLDSSKFFSDFKGWQST